MFSEQNNSISIDSPKLNKSTISSFLNLNFFICLLGNFVDQYDLFLFSSIRVSSLKSLGLDSAQVLNSGIFVLNCQLSGMLAGGIIGGIIGDKSGRLKTLFGSVILYSLANLANAFVTSVGQYGVCRFLAGVGLAGEVGVCITVILESLPISLRGYGIMLLMALGHTAAILASIMSNLISWRTNFFMGGIMGVFVLLLRAHATEPELYLKMAQTQVNRGDFLKIFRHWSYLKKYIKGILVATPTWFAFTLLVILGPEVSRELGLVEIPQPERYMPFYFGGLIISDLSSGIIGQILKSRKKVIAFYIMMIGIISATYLLSQPLTLTKFNFLITGLGLFSGYTVMSFTVAAEQFGTNLRSTAATTTPNFVRASAILFTTAFSLLKLRVGILTAAGIIGAVCISLAWLSAISLEETYGKDLDFVD